MACPRCARWQHHVMSTQQKIRNSRQFSTSRRLREEQTSAQNSASQDQPSLGLSILEHKRRPVQTPNDRVRSAAHAIDVSQRLGTRFSRPVIGGMEWQTSTYHYNKQTSKTLPVLANTTNKLLEAYAVLQKSKTGRDGLPAPAAKADVAKRRKLAERVFVSAATAKDYGHKIVINAFVHDAKEAENKSLDQKQAQRARPRRPAGAAGRGRTPGRPSGFRASNGPRPTATGTGTGDFSSGFRKLSFGKKSSPS